ncbi:hypothetical protein EUTSA_v10021379mg [Eutrema salsugineum]|uniref:Uncharacterized protein n=1 Tax=Eutrema salsugineum TaxID=72664 RepID=V4LG33_EUTSA|nr:nuclear transcription factor Y subunit gamma [Eutrema salsugineum]ESQ49455.1 hypothetical protein EUTSA_v10021379mg [Eutrema salsugineum]
MVSEAISQTESPPLIGPRISFSADLSDGGDFICITPAMCKELEKDVVKGSVKVADFEFLSENVSPQRMLTADELFSEGKLLPFWQVKHSEKLKNVNLKTNEEEVEEENRKVEVTMKNKDQENNNNNNNNRVSWFIDEDPSPRPPKCTVLWKELLRLKKQRNSSSSSSVRTVSSLSPSSSTSSSSSLEDAAAKREEREKEGKRGKKGLERTRSASMRIRPMIHVPICTPSKSSVPLPPLFPLALKKNRVERRT